MSGPPAPAVFLSYASQDAEAAARICEALRAAGVEVWFDQNELVGGDAWDQKIRNQVKSCALFVPVISAATQARREGYFRIEWKLAAQRTQAMADGTPFLLPVVIDATKDGEALVPEEFRAVQWTRLPGGEAAEKFCARVQALLESGTGVSPEGSNAGPAHGRDARVASKPRRRIPAMAWLGAVAIALVVVAFMALRPKSEAGAGTGPPSAEKSAAEKTLAVLAFANLSDDPGNDSFSDSVSEELLNVLTKTPGLRVTARTSAFHFKGRNTPIPEIGKQLGVAYVVEGSVRRSGDRVRITAQLVKAADGFPVWSETFTRDFKEVFALQDEVAGLVARNLQLKLGLRVADRPANAEAYALYLEAGRAWALRGADSLARAEALLKRALELEPQFPRAFALMSLVLTQAGSGGVLLAPTEADRALFARAQVWVDRALAAAPDLAEAHAAQGNLLDRAGRWADAKAAYRRAIELDPAYATPRQWYARSLMSDGQVDEALAEMRRAAESDPLAPRILDNYATMLNWIGQPERALELLDRVSVLQGDSANATTFRGAALLQLGRPAEAIALLAPLVAGPRPENRSFQVTFLAKAYLSAGRREEAEALASLPEIEPHYRGIVLCALGRSREGIPLLRPVASAHRLSMMANFDQLPRDDPEFLRRLKDWGMAESWERIVAWRRKHTPEVFNPPPPAAPAPVARADDKSVAVLAFANLAEDKANEYFSDGISEELLNVLAKIPGLKVSARTSAFHFKGRNTPIPEIAKQLGVAYVVEGSVRKAGDKVRITALLIKAADGFHVWSDTFTRELKDIFVVQDEIAGLIAQKISPTLTRSAYAGPSRQVDPEAFQRYLEGRALAAKAGLDQLRQAIALFDRAVQLDPGFHLARVQAARAYVQLGRWGGMVPREAWVAAKAALAPALAAEPDAPEVLVAQGWLLRTADWKWREAEQAFARALAQRPGDTDVLVSAAVLKTGIGKSEEAHALARRAIELDPLNPTTQFDLGLIYRFSDRLPEAERQLRRAIELSPSGQRYRTFLALVAVGLGRLEEAEELARNEPDELSREFVFGLAAAARGDQARLRKIIAQLDAQRSTLGKLGDYNAYLGSLRGAAGDLDGGMAELEAARAARDPSIGWVKVNYIVRSLHPHPRWNDFLRSLGLADDQLK